MNSLGGPLSTCPEGGLRMQLNEWRVMIAETRTGNIVADVTPASLPDFSRGICEVGSWSVTAHLDDPANQAIDFHTFATSSRYSWVVCYGDYAVQAGPVTTYSIDDEARTLSVGGAGIGWFFQRRVLRNPAGSKNDPVPAIVNESEDIHWDGEFKWEVLRRLMLYGIAEDGTSQIVPGAPAYLPITYPPGWPNQGSGNASQGSYYAYDLAMIWDRMVQLSEQRNGPEFEFAPVISSDGSKITWDLRIGEPLLGDQESPAVWDYGGALSYINVDGDASTATVTRTWVKGEGSDRALKTGFEEDMDLYDLGYPRIDYVDTEHTSVVLQSTLEAYADHILDSFRWPLETWSATVRVDGLGNTYGGYQLSPPLGQWSLGDAPQFGIQGHRWIPDGNYRRRIIGFSSATENTVNLTLEEGIAQ